MLLARTLAAPLGRVAAAAEAIAGGDLSQRVPEQGTDETRAVARSFNQMAANLEQAEQLRRNLMADVAHELRTPLTVIQGNLQALLDGVYPLERGEIATIYDETRLLSRLVADLRDLAQAEAGQLRLTMQPVDLSAVLTQTAASFAPVAEAQGTTLVVAASAAPASTEAASADAPSALWVLADPDRLAQVLRNLLSNALRHTPQGGEVRVDVQNDLQTTSEVFRDLGGLSASPSKTPAPASRLRICPTSSIASGRARMALAAVPRPTPAAASAWPSQSISSKPRAARLAWRARWGKGHGFGLL